MPTGSATILNIMTGDDPVDGTAKEIRRLPFNRDETDTLRRAIDIAEELISDHYKISTSDWKRYRYDIQSLKDLQEEEIINDAFAQIRRYRHSPHLKLRGSETGDYFKICLQDHVIRGAVERDSRIRLFPLTTYISVHELIHVIRFAKFLQRFDSTPPDQEAEEKRVHLITYELLGPRKLKEMEEVLAAFRDCRTMETFFDPRRPSPGLH